MKFIKISKVQGGITKDPINFKDIPLGAQKLLRKRNINYVEQGLCADMSEFRGYSWNKDTDQLKNITGGSWEFKPIGAFVKEG